MSQTKNKKLIYNVLTIMTYLTSSNEDVKDNPKKLNDLNGYLEDYKELFSIPEFADTLIKVLGDIVKAEEKTKNHYNMMEVSSCSPSSLSL
jgi:hypothetical protein